MEVQRAPWLIPKGNLFIGSVCIKQTDFSHDYTANFHFTPKRNIEVAAKIIKGYCKREHMIDILQEVKGLQSKLFFCKTGLASLARVIGFDEKWFGLAGFVCLD